jgi:hypothetical protein
MLQSNVVIKRAGPYIVDVFYGPEGWEDWARFRVQDNRLHVVTCPKQLPPAVMKEVKYRLTKAPAANRRTK